MGGSNRQLKLIPKQFAHLHRASAFCLSSADSKLSRMIAFINYVLLARCALSIIVKRRSCSECNLNVLSLINSARSWNIFGDRLRCSQAIAFSLDGSGAPQRGK